jgi:hypothetical protein
MTAYQENLEKINKSFYRKWISKHIKTKPMQTQKKKKEVSTLLGCFVFLSFCPSVFSVDM